MPYKANRPDLRHGWEVRMHHEHPNADGLVLNPRNPQQAECPMCKVMKQRFLLIDVSALPQELTGGANWACDGCWSRWEREERRLPDGRIFDESIMYELMGAPTPMINEIAEANRAFRRTIGKPDR